MRENWFTYAMIVAAMFWVLAGLALVCLCAMRDELKDVARYLAYIHTALRDIADRVGKRP